MQNSIHADWYFDFISPFAYLQLEQFDRFPEHLNIAFKPVVFAALLSHWENKGPAEIPHKRMHTYRYAHFRAEQLGIPFRMPPMHPFNPIKMLRLALVMNCERQAVREIFRFIWREGNDATDHEQWLKLCSRLGVKEPDEAVVRTDIKDALHRNTDQAIARGVFGVPTLIWNDELFWGEDATALFLHCFKSPAWLQSDEVQRISALPVGVQRRM